MKFKKNKHILKASSIFVMQSTCPKLKKMKESRVFCILAVEVRDDRSSTEQMLFVMRYVDKSCQIREEFIQFLE